MHRERPRHFLSLRILPLGSYEYGSDTITISSVLKEAPLEILDYIMYHFGINHVLDVFKKGEIVVRDKSLV